MRTPMDIDVRYLRVNNPCAVPNLADVNDAERPA